MAVVSSQRRSPSWVVAECVSCDWAGRVQPRRRNRTAEAGRALRLLASGAWLGLALQEATNQPAKLFLLLIFFFLFRG
ncbi:hypothetical protein N5D25_20275, partial [Stenotrophomonas maltophilia]|uniref:hypothetical protein n=1 Tax=Stenotrophomonas maltophilia TaxID=40324 RepID=UPI00244BC975